jgi:hypothetical protein
MHRLGRTLRSLAGLRRDARRELFGPIVDPRVEITPPNVSDSFVDIQMLEVARRNARAREAARPPVQERRRGA